MKSRIEKLREKLGFISDSELSSAIGVSVRSLYYAKKNDRYSAKFVWKLEQAEREAGIEPAAPTVEEVIERARTMTREDTDFWLTDNYRKEFNSLLDDMVKTVTATVADTAENIKAKLKEMQDRRASIKSPRRRRG